MSTAAILKDSRKTLGLSWCSDSKVYSAEDGVQSLGREDPLEKVMVTNPVFLRGKTHGQRSLAGYSPWGCKVRHD